MRPMLCIHRHEELPSTNDEAVRLARNGAPEGTVIWAERQTAGRGRRGRAWDSPAGNLYMSVIVRPDVPLAKAGRIGVASGLMVAHRYSSLLRTKWPNDLYHAGRKVGGILVETRAGSGGALEWAVVGLGINVVSHPDVAPPAQPAGHLPPGALTGASNRNTGATVEILANLLVKTSALAESDDWWRACQTIFWPRFDLTNGPVRVLEDSREYEAIGIGIDDDGALLVRVGKDVRRVTAGDVSVRVLGE